MKSFSLVSRTVSTVVFISNVAGPTVRVTGDEGQRRLHLIPAAAVIRRGTVFDGMEPFNSRSVAAVIRRDTVYDCMGPFNSRSVAAVIRRGTVFLLYGTVQFTVCSCRNTPWHGF